MFNGVPILTIRWNKIEDFQDYDIKEEERI